MGLLDKILGRGKRTMGEATDSPDLKEEGRRQEEAERAAERAVQHEEMAQEERERSAGESAEGDRPL